MLIQKNWTSGTRKLPFPCYSHLTLPYDSKSAKRAGQAGWLPDGTASISPRKKTAIAKVSILNPLPRVTEKEVEE